MLSNAYFYYELTKKYVVLFGNLFNNMSLIRTNSTTDAEIERIKIPIIYAPKEKYFARLRADENLDRPVQAILPRMSFEMTGISYDAGRKQNTLYRTARGNTATRVASQYMGVPYDLNFELNIYVRNIDDGTHIVEQILPYFTPDYTISANLIPELGFIKDIPITLLGVTNTIEHEGNFDTVRYVTWTLSFTMKAYYFGPVSVPKIIRKVITNINAYNTVSLGNIIRINTSGGNNGAFKIDDIAYQGDKYDTATAYGIVQAWSANTGKLVLESVQGTFQTNATIRTGTTNASYNLSSFDTTPVTYSRIVVEPDPITANANDDFGYSTTITEWPETIGDA